MTTVFKKPGVVFPPRDGESALDPSHLREYTDLDAFRKVVESGFELLRSVRMLWFPPVDPVLFRLGHRYPGLSSRPSVLRALRAPRVPIPGYYSLEVVLERPL